jgi:hypothetical protein
MLQDRVGSKEEAIKIKLQFASIMASDPIVPRPQVGGWASGIPIRLASQKSKQVEDGKYCPPISSQTESVKLEHVLLHTLSNLHLEGCPDDAEGIKASCRRMLWNQAASKFKDKRWILHCAPASITALMRQLFIHFPMHFLRWATSLPLFEACIQHSSSVMEEMETRRSMALCCLGMGQPLK